MVRIFVGLAFLRMFGRLDFVHLAILGLLKQSVTILTPFSISPMTDASVDALPTLFLAYCAMDHTDSDLAD